MNNAIVSGIVAILASIVIVVGWGAFHPSVQHNDSQPTGSLPGGDIYQPTAFYDYVVNRNAYASTSQGSTITMSAGDFRSWVRSNGVVSFTQGLPATATITFPASSTVADLVPKAGDRQTFCVRSATSTAGVATIFAGSTGINLLVASSSATALGGKMLLTGKIGCFTLIRQPATATTFDIDALLTVFQ